MADLIEFRVIKRHCYSYDCGLLSLHQWNRYRLYGNSIMFIISDEDDNLQWVYSKPSSYPVEIKIPRSSIYHQITVTAMILEEDIIRAGRVEDGITRYFRIIAKLSVAAIDWPPVDRPVNDPPVEELSSRMASLQMLPADDLRPRLRRSVTMKLDNDPMEQLFKDGSFLPTEQSLDFSAEESSISLEFFQENRCGYDVDRSSLMKLDVAFSTTAAAVRQGSVSLAISEDGTVVAAVSELKGDYREMKTTVKRRADVICPKIPVDGGERLSLKLQPGEDSDAAATVCIAYDIPASVNQWLISVTKTNEPSVGRIFSVAASGPSLQFLIPFDVIAAEAMATDAVASNVGSTDAVATDAVAVGVGATDSTEYDVEVSGLQLLDKESCCDVSRVLCRSKTTVKRPAKGTEVRNIQDLEIKIIQKNVHEIVVSVPRGIPAADQWILKVEKLATPSAAILCPRQIKQFEKPAILDNQMFEVPLHFQAGSTYGLTLEGLVQAATVYRGVAKFRADNTVNEIRTLYEKAVEFAGRDEDAVCLWFYRNKSPKYFEDVRKHGGLMRAYDKDNSGDPGNPINLRIKGLFFTATVDYGLPDSQPIRFSPYGSTRILVPAQPLLDMAPNTYFADFFCMGTGNHVVTLVLTKTGTEADRLCADRLWRIDINNQTGNPFLFWRNKQLMVSAKRRLFVEVLFTLDLDIHSVEYEIQEDIPTWGSGSTTPGGLQKVNNCTTCTLLSPEEKRTFQFF